MTLLRWLFAVFVTLGIQSMTVSFAQQNGNAVQSSSQTIVNPPDSLRVRLITRDAETGKTIPCRITIADSSGQFRGLKGILTAQRNFFHSPGDTLLFLNPGAYRITAFRGNEYAPIRDSAFVVSSSPTPSGCMIELALKRWIHMKKLGWFSCDQEVHASGTLSPRGIYTVQLGEDLNILQLDAMGEGNWKTDYQHWTTGPFPFSQPFYPMLIGEEWRSKTWQNHMIIMHASRPLSEYGNGFYESADCPYRFSFPPALDFIDEARSLGGIVVACHPFAVAEPWTLDPANPYERHSAYELPVDAALGKIDGMQVYCYTQNDAWNRYVWYKLLNCGFRIPPFTGTDVLNFTGDAYGEFPGIVRTYAYVKGQTNALDYSAWIQAAKQGRSFVSSGAVVFFTVDGEMPGSEVKVRAGKNGATVAVHAEARWMGGIKNISVVVNGEAVFTQPGEGKQHVVFTRDLPISRSSWIAVNVEGNPVGPLHGCAHSAPVYVTLGNRPIRSGTDSRYFVDWIDRFIARLDSANHFETAESKARMFAQYRKGQDVFRDLAKTSGVDPVTR